MEDRYEILEQIGHGGIGSVKRAFDHKMNRHVAIKRIHVRQDDPVFLAEATKQIVSEVGALSALQHPHIVTVFDVGEDEEGPYVVMELLDGKTLDEIIEGSPLTWEDFRIIAMQSLEALLAAHDLDLIHSDLKPPNIMLTWMPSGAFQIKIVDFGLATLIHQQSQEEIEQMDSVYGSVYFMPPEQLERQTLDARSDLYSLGCCFYQSLAGCYPFDGETVLDVAQAHIDHAVAPLHELRHDVPRWACDWIMRLISRDREDRPLSAREALAEFVQLERNAKAAEAEAAQAAQVEKKSRLITSNVAPVPATGVVGLSRDTAHVSADAALAAGPVSGATGPAPTSATHAVAAEAGKKKSFKKLWWILPPVAAAVLFFATSWLLKRNEMARLSNAYQGIVATATQSNIRTVHLSAGQLQTVFDFIRMAGSGIDLAPAIVTLNKAAASDGTDIDTAIAAFATDTEVPGDIRLQIFREVVASRRASKPVPLILDYVAKAGGEATAMAAIEAIGPMIREQDAEGLLQIIAKSGSADVRQAAEARFSEIVNRSTRRTELAKAVADVAAKAGDSPAREHFERLSALLQSQSTSQSGSRSGASQRSQPSSPAQPRASGSAQRSAQQSSSDPAQETAELMEAFESSEGKGKLEIIAALGRSGASDASTHLNNILRAAETEELRTAAIRALIELNSGHVSERDDGVNRRTWVRIMWSCETPEQRRMLIDALASFRKEWATNMINEMRRHRNPEVSSHAKKAFEKLQQAEND